MRALCSLHVELCLHPLACARLLIHRLGERVAENLLATRLVHLGCGGTVTSQ